MGCLWRCVFNWWCPPYLYILKTADRSSRFHFPHPSITRDSRWNKYHSLPVGGEFKRCRKRARYRQKTACLFICSRQTLRRPQFVMQMCVWYGYTVNRRLLICVALSLPLCGRRYQIYRAIHNNTMTKNEAAPRVHRRSVYLTATLILKTGPCLIQTNQMHLSHTLTTCCLSCLSLPDTVLFNVGGLTGPCTVGLCYRGEKE